jgi:hypothetical protein
MISQSNSRLRGQVLTDSVNAVTITLHDLLQVPFSYSSISNSIALSLCARPSHHRLAAPPNHASTIWDRDRMRRQSAAETMGHSRTYSISTVSKIHFQQRQSYSPSTTAWHRNCLQHVHIKPCAVLQYGAFRHSAA